MHFPNLSLNMHFIKIVYQLPEQKITEEYYTHDNQILSFCEHIALHSSALENISEILHWAKVTIVANAESHVAGHSYFLEISRAQIISRYLRQRNVDASSHFEYGGRFYDLIVPNGVRSRDVMDPLLEETPWELNTGL